MKLSYQDGSVYTLSLIENCFVGKYTLKPICTMIYACSTGLCKECVVYQNRQIAMLCEDFDRLMKIQTDNLLVQGLVGNLITRHTKSFLFLNGSTNYATCLETCLYHFI